MRHDLVEVARLGMQTLALSKYELIAEWAVLVSGTHIVMHKLMDVMIHPRLFAQFEDAAFSADHALKQAAVCLQILS